MIRNALASSSSLRLGESCVSKAVEEKGYEFLENHASTIALEPAEVLLHEGEEGDRFYVVEDGTIEAVDRSDKVMHVFQKKDRFGERWLLFPHGPAGATCRAGPDGATLKAVSRADFQSQFANCFICAGPFRGKVIRAKTTKNTRFLDKDVSEFRGIRYATRASRFALPEVKELCEGETFDAFDFGPECAQIGAQLFDQLVPKQAERSRPSLLQFVHNTKNAPTDEDCLCLNIYAPTGTSGGISAMRLPVMVWIHGGAFVTGSGSIPMYNGRELASKGVIVVTINYRLGALGFLSGVPDIPLNLGLHDQLMALRWVKKNISTFGGDPQNVSVFGESAGAMSVACLLGMKVRRQEQLFQKAIMQSGSAYAVLSQTQAETVTETFASALMDQLKLPKTTMLTRELLDTCPVDAIVKATESTSTTMATKDLLRGVVMAFQPVCWENGPITYDLLFECVHPLVQIARGIAQDVTLMLGVNNTEYTLFMLDNYWRRLFAKAKGSRKTFKATLQSKILSWAHAEDKRYRFAQNIQARAKSIVDYYLPDSGSDEITEDDAGRAFERIHSVWLFEQGSDAVCELKAGDGSSKPVYTYRLHFLASMNQLGSPHALELPFVFGTFRTDPLAGLLTGDGPEAVQCSKEMMGAWIAFAKSGNPGWNPDKPRIFGADPSAAPVPEDIPTKSVFASKKERALWNGFMERVELDMNRCRARAKL